MNIGVVGIVHPHAVGGDVFRWVQQAHGPQHQQFKVLDEPGYSVARQRNRLTERALETYGHALKWLAYVDADGAPPLDALVQLEAFGEPLISAAIRSRHAPYPLVGLLKADPAGEALRWVRWAELPESGKPLPLQRVGFGCVMVAGFVLRQMTPPWFRAGEIVPDILGEDVGFCARAWTEAKVRPCMTRDVRVRHRSEVLIGPEANEDETAIAIEGVSGAGHVSRGTWLFGRQAEQC